MATAKYSDFYTGVNSLETGHTENQFMWPYWAAPRFPAHLRPEMTAWLIDTFGNSNLDTPNSRWVGRNGKYWFRDDADRTFFILRWA